LTHKVKTKYIIGVALPTTHALNFNKHIRDINEPAVYLWTSTLSVPEEHNKQVLT